MKAMYRDAWIGSDIQIRVRRQSFCFTSRQLPAQNMNASLVVAHDDLIISHLLNATLPGSSATPTTSARVS